MSHKDTVYSIKLDKIAIGNLSVRHSNPQQALEELAASIRRHSLLQPVLLAGVHGRPPYELIAGRRRLYAHERLSKKTIRAIFLGDVDEEKASVLSLIENVHSLKLNHADCARAITELYLSYGKDERRVQRETGLSLRRIRDYLTIDSQASPKMKRRLRDKKVTPADVKRALCAAPARLKKAEEILDLMCSLPLTGHQKKRVVEYAQTHQRESARKIIQEASRPRVEQSMWDQHENRPRFRTGQARSRITEYFGVSFPLSFGISFAVFFFCLFPSKDGFLQKAS